ncbi:MAG: DUF2442 domain-containing protein [Deltaproteobacteria bacterium]|nr:DUF2442 domain-containing protein [Deltaproteobacteria bacterium]
MSTLPKRSEALAVEVSCTGDELTVILADGRTVSAPIAWFPRLLAATRKQRNNWELIGGGVGIHWESIDEDISVASLLQPENFVRLSPGPLQPRRKKRLVKVRRQSARG